MAQAPAGGAGDAELTLRVRDATAADMPLVHAMILELAAHEGVPDGPALTPRDLVEDGFEADPPWFFALLAEACEAGAGEGEGAGECAVLGYALCTRAYSSWTRRAYYMEDLYVRPAWRRRGVARALLRALCARQAGSSRVDWHVQLGNAAARAFYASLGARDLRHTEGRAALRLDREAIQALAAEHEGGAPDTRQAPAPAPQDAPH